MASADYTSAFDAAMRDIARQRAGLTDLQNRTNTRLGEDFDTGVQQFTDMRDQAIKNLQDYLAGNGNIRSGANLVQTGLLNKDFAQNVSNLVRQRTRGVEDVDTNVRNSNAQLLAQEEQLNIQRAQAQAQDQLQQAQMQASALANAQPVYQPDGTYALPNPATLGAPVSGQNYQTAAQRKLNGGY